MADPLPPPSPHYRQPGWFTRNVFNRAVDGLTRLGVSVWGSRVLEVPGRKTGEPRRNPVNLLTHEGRQYLVAPRGTTQARPPPGRAPRGRPPAGAGPPGPPARGGRGGPGRWWRRPAPCS